MKKKKKFAQAKYEYGKATTESLHFTRIMEDNYSIQCVATADLASPLSYSHMYWLSSLYQNEFYKDPSISVVIRKGMEAGDDREQAREIARYQEELKDPSISVERRKGMVSGEDREQAREIARYQEELKDPSISVERRKGMVSGEDREQAREIARYQEELKDPSISGEARKASYYCNSLSSVFRTVCYSYFSCSDVPPAHRLQEPGSLWRDTMITVASGKVINLVRRRYKCSNVITCTASVLQTACDHSRLM